MHDKKDNPIDILAWRQKTI